MMRTFFIAASLFTLAALAACGDETPADEHEHVCTDGAWKCDGDKYSVCSADAWGALQSCPTGQVCMEMDGGAMCM